MASIKQIIFVLVFSLLLIGGIAWWMEHSVPESASLLHTDETLDGPIAPKELQANNSDTTHTMNRIAIMDTNKGTIKIELYEDVMPITTGNFIKLAQEGFYDGIKFHRVIDGFMIQGGDPNTKGDDTSTYGRGGPGYTIQDEFVSDPRLSNVRGTIAMANTGQPNSGGSQFFINTVDNLALDFDKEPFTSRHPVFGRVIDGMNVVDAISEVPVTPGNNMPIDPVVINSVKIVDQDSAE
jgi:cyclophilin family peptidyl-prolyl cis-trans isomerase